MSCTACSSNDLSRQKSPVSPPSYDEQTTTVSKKFLSCFQAFWQLSAHCPLLAVQQEQQQNCCACITFFIVAKTFNLHGMTSIK